MYRSYLETILLGICDNLQLAPSLYTQATERYTTIAKTIQQDPAFNQITLNMYPHGSFRLKTTVKPLSDDEFDLDFVAELPSVAAMTPHELYNHIVRILRTDGIHNNMVELKKRCVRVNYANDFHMDIMPGKLISPETKEIIVPDHELKGWNHHSNPIGFADWFERQAKTRILFEMSEFWKFQHNIEKVTDQEVTEQLEPLRRAVQLVKRYRDIFCEKSNTEPVRSIVICTMMGSIASFTGNTLQIIENFCNYVNGLIAESNGEPFIVKNPVVDEVLTEKWKEGSNYQDFVSMMKSLTDDVNVLKTLSTNSDINALVKEMFGEAITNLVLTNYAKKLSETRAAGKLNIDPNGVLTTHATGIPVRKNTFYGSGLVEE